MAFNPIQSGLFFLPPATGGGGEGASEAPSIFQKLPGLNNDRYYWPIGPLATYGDLHNTFHNRS